MNNNCIFCNIINGDINSTKLYEDEDVLVIADAFPSNKGHFLVLPKKHTESMFDIDNETLCKIYTVTKKVCTAFKKAYPNIGINIVQNNGQLSGQVVFHFHVHIIPVYENEDKIITFKSTKLDIEKTNKIVADLKKHM